MTRRVRPVAEEAVPAWVADRARKFEYPFPQPQLQRPSLGGGGGAPTVVVAASDATEISKQKADFVCTGVNDQLVIQQAINDFTPGSPWQGARVLLTEGVFNINMDIASFEGVRLDYGIIQGMGQEATILNAGATAGSTDDPILLLASFRCTVRDLSFQGGSGTRVTGVMSDAYDSVIENCHFDTNGQGVLLTDDGIRVTNNHFEGVDGVSATGLSTGDLVSIIGNVFDLSGFGIHFGGSSRPQTAVIANNVMSGGSSEDAINLGATAGIGCVVANNSINGFLNGIEFLDQRNVAIVGNTINACAAHGIRGHADTLLAGRGNVIADNIILEPGETGIFLDGPASSGGSVPNLVTGNKIHSAGTSGMRFDDIDDVTVVGNLIFEPDEHGIFTEDSCNNFHVHGNTIIGASNDSDNTFDGIFLNTNCSEWYIHGNKIQSYAATPATRYAVNVSAASDSCNIVVGNDFGPVADYGTDPINDAGTDTQWFWPADATYGDNFTDCAGSPGSP